MGRRISDRLAQEAKKFFDEIETEKQLEEAQKEMIAQTSTVQVVQAIQLLVDELLGRDIAIKDFDERDRHIVQFQIIGNDIYFLAAKGDK